MLLLPGENKTDRETVSSCPRASVLTSREDVEQVSSLALLCLCKNSLPFRLKRWPLTTCHVSSSNRNWRAEVSSQALAC